jgi:hypothetical protein
MNYRQSLTKVQELGISICDLEIANELDCVLDFEYTDEQFEQLCEFCLNAYLKSESVTANALALAVNDLIAEGNTVDEVLELDKWTFIDKASYYM